MGCCNIYVITCTVDLNLDKSYRHYSCNHKFLPNKSVFALPQKFSTLNDFLQMVSSGPIVSCTNTTIAPNNLNILGMDVQRVTLPNSYYKL